MISKYVYEEPKKMKKIENTSKNNLNKISTKEFSFSNSDKLAQTKVKPQPEEKIENITEDCLENKIDDFQRDETKWKFTKNELLERKKKMLKDKSLFKQKN